VKEGKEEKEVAAVAAMERKCGGRKACSRA
jgi:hypothetical protein